MRLLGTLVLLLALAAPAGAQTASLSDNGHAAVAVERIDGSDTRPKRAGVDVLQGDRTQFGLPAHISHSGELIGAVAQPDGSARVILWTEDFDFRRPHLTPLDRLISITVDPDGHVGPPEQVSGNTDVELSEVRMASNGAGDVLLGWGTENGAAYAAAGRPFTVVDVPGQTPAAPAVAPNGAMLLAGSDQYMERPPGGTFGPPSTLSAVDLREV